ncbi:MAG: relaxase/mobilization nuclease domain-containing protein [Chitinophagaceae bacterium]|nr:relaxase/mobilization nuclease domain-containing protein [Chitinophagaceae bacterium]
MDKIGFGNQPYLVYIHYDAGHPHIHIVATNIKKDGKRISLHNIGRNQSTKARREIEQMYNLVKAEDQKKKTGHEIKVVSAQRVHYGKLETKKSITNVLDHVPVDWRYSSMAELNTVLKLYNVVADRGKEEGLFIKKRTGISVYWMKGNKVGVPVKASSIYSKPTLDKLEKGSQKMKN